MRNTLRSLILAIVVSLLLTFALPSQPNLVQSQDGGDDEVCVDVVAQALQAIGSGCAEMGRNEACYGHVNVQATFREGVEAQFENNGDIVDVADLESLLTEASDPSSETWGVAILNLQADLPDESEDSVTLVLFGDAEITSTVSEDGSGDFAAPMQAITLRSGDTSNCEQAPDGLLIRSPEGQRSRIMVNGVELTLSSATFITAGTDSDMGIQGLEGEIEVTAEGQTETVTPGFISTVSLDENFEPDAPPTPPEPVDPNIEFPFEVFSGVFADATDTSTSTGNTGGQLANSFSGDLVSFSYPDGWIAVETSVPYLNVSIIAISNNEAYFNAWQSDPTASTNIPEDTVLIAVYALSDFNAAFDGVISGSTADEAVRSYGELVNNINFVTEGPSVIELGPHSVTRLRLFFDFSGIGLEGIENFETMMYGLNNTIVAISSSAGILDSYQATIEDIISSFSFDG